MWSVFIKNKKWNTNFYNVSKKTKITNVHDKIMKYDAKVIDSVRKNKWEYWKLPSLYLKINEEKNINSKKCAQKCRSFHVDFFKAWNNKRHFGDVVTSFISRIPFETRYEPLIVGKSIFHTIDSNSRYEICRKILFLK